MKDLFLAVLAAMALALPVSIVLGFVYFSLALVVVKTFGLNYGERPRGFLFLNLAVFLTLFSYFVSFAVILRLYR